MFIKNYSLPQCLSKGFFFSTKINLNKLTAEQLQKYVTEELHEPAFRATQLRHWVVEKQVREFDKMMNLPLPFRKKLEEMCTVSSQLEVVAEQVSKVDGTLKRAYRLHDGRVIESVLMRYEDGRNTACISSQAGCAMNCSFCATGQGGFYRNLTASEIFEQALLFKQFLEAQKTLSGQQQTLSNVVFMGMGEPFGNYANVLTSCQQIHDELSIGARHITISTVGLVPKIIQLSKEALPVRLAISLHAADDQERSSIMPVNKRFPLTELMDACRQYQLNTAPKKRRITFEWAAMAGKNDSPQEARKLGTLLHGINAHVNVIPLNPTAGFSQQQASSPARVNSFCDILLHEFNISATPRVRRGIDIDAGCGQLSARFYQDAQLQE